jgi:D-3-phosphoglycerate dehydrogenase
MLFVRNEDKPGFIGRLGTVLGDAGINIANFNLGRRPEGGSALALVSVDSPVSDEIVKTVMGLPSVVQAKALNF